MAEEIDGTWDRDAFWYPTADRTGLLLGLWLVLVVLHFDKLLGLQLDGIIFGWLPTQFAYHLLIALLAIGYGGLLYRYWPRPSSDVIAEVEDDG